MRNMLFILILFCTVAYCSAKIIYVDIAGPNNPGTGSVEDPFQGIQDAISDSNTNDGDTVIVAEGLYLPDTAAGINFFGKSIILRSSDPNDPNVIAATIIDPNQTGRCFYFGNGEDANSILSGFTITGGNKNYGGGIYCLNSNPTVSKCIITGNSADFGGGIVCISAEPVITNCIINDNYAESKGGVIAYSNSSPTLTNCTITNNNSGLYSHSLPDTNSRALVVNCIFAHNTGLAIDEFGDSADPNISYCCFYNNSGGDWYDYDSSSILTGSASINLLGEAKENISLEPLIGLDGYHLKPNSPCINRGDSFADGRANTDIDGQPRTLYGRVDIGADEVFPIMGDFEPDADIDITDVSVVSSHWLQTGPNTPGNIDADNIVNLLDLALLAKNWMLNSEKFKDLNQDRIVNFKDFAVLAQYWTGYTCIEPDWCNGSDFDESGQVGSIDLRVFTKDWLFQYE